MPHERPIAPYNSVIAVLDQVPGGILITEAATGKVSYANAAAAELLGIPLEQLVGTPLSITPQESRAPHVHGQPAIPWQFAVVRALSGETVTSLDTLVVRPDGGQVPTLSSSAPLRNAYGVVTGAVLVFQDVTVQKRLEQHKQEFLAMASHELRTPVMAILGYADLLCLITSQERAWMRIRRRGCSKALSARANTFHAWSRICSTWRVLSTRSSRCSVYPTNCAPCCPR